MGSAIDLTGHYAALPARGYGYGPSFQGLVEAWRVGDVVYGRAVLAEALTSIWRRVRAASGAAGCSALHVLSLRRVAASASDGSLLLPFEWSDVRLAASGARELRIRASVERAAMAKRWRICSLRMGSGRVVAHVGGLRLRQASQAQIREASRSEAQHLYRLEWRAVALSEAASEALPLMVAATASWRRVWVSITSTAWRHLWRGLTRAQASRGRSCSIISRSWSGAALLRRRMRLRGAVLWSCRGSWAKRV